MRPLKRLSLLATSLLLLAPQLSHAQDAGQAVEDPAANAFGFTNFWDLIGQAGWFRWFILGVLVIGLFLVFKQLFELWDDKRRSSEFESLPLSELSLENLEHRVTGESDHMLARLISMLLNVYRNSGVAIMLHEEVANFVQLEQERFGTFKQRVDFLSDSAGAFGLLGTVWGIFLVFSQRDLDPQNILGGMGLALITTLLGLVVSIILNLCSTEVSNFFTSRLDSITAKADEVRFRLMKDSEGASRGLVQEWMKQQIAEGNYDAAGQHPGGAPQALRGSYKNDTPGAWPSSPNPHGEKASSWSSDAHPYTNDTPPSRLQSGGASDGAVSAVLESRQVAPARIELLTPITNGVIGQEVKNITLKVADKLSRPVPEVDVQLSVRQSEGLLDREAAEIVRQTDHNGLLSFDWRFGPRPGKHVLEAVVSGTPRLRFQVDVKGRIPTRLNKLGNNQSAQAGKALPKHLGVQILDDNDEAIPGIAIQFSVQMGNGSFDTSKTNVLCETDTEGIATTPFTLGEAPGFNQVVAMIEGVDKKVTFQAMGIEA